MDIFFFLRKIDPSSLEPCKQSQKFQLKYCHHTVNKRVFCKKQFETMRINHKLKKKVYIFQYHHLLHSHQTIYSLIIVGVFA